MSISYFFFFVHKRPNAHDVPHMFLRMSHLHDNCGGIDNVKTGFVTNPMTALMVALMGLWSTTSRQAFDHWHHFSHPVNLVFSMYLLLLPQIDELSFLKDCH
jgi:hypothetical protein